MKIVVTGTRGIPKISGGVETHCEELLPRIAAMGHDVTVIRRSCYVTDDNRIPYYNGVKLKDIYAPRKKSLEAIVHTFLAVLAARFMNADVLHIHAVGPSLMVPFARLLGLKVVTTNHGPDYDRKKWGFFAKTMLKLGERLGAKCSHEVISISRTIQDSLKEKYGRDSHLIFNGVNLPYKTGEMEYPMSLGLRYRRYVLAVGRFVKEKCFDMLIDAYNSVDHKGYKLVLAGDADHPDEYSEMLKEKARKSGVILTGFIRGEKLHQIYENAAFFVLPSTHEGLPISLLEAMSFDLNVVVSDIPANKLPELSKDNFFKVGDIQSLKDRLTERFSSPPDRKFYSLANYDWDKIAKATEQVYKDAYFSFFY